MTGEPYIPDSHQPRQGSLWRLSPSPFLCSVESPPWVPLSGNVRAPPDRYHVILGGLSHRRGRNTRLIMRPCPSRGTLVRVRSRSALLSKFASVPHAPPSLPITRYARDSINKIPKTPTVFLFLFFVLWFDGSIKRLICTNPFYIFFPFITYSLVEQAVPSGHKQRSTSQGEVCSIQRGVRCSRKR